MQREREIRRERARHEKQLQRSQAAKARHGATQSSSPPARDSKEASNDTVPAGRPAARELNWIERQLPLLKVGGIIALFVAGVVYVTNLIRRIVPGVLGTIIRIALFLGVGVYVFNAYSQKVAKAFQILSSEADYVQKTVDKRSERIEKQAGGP